MNWLSFYLLNVDRRLVQTLRPTTSLDTFHGATKDFHEDGLYSLLTYGAIGSERRDTTFSYIDLGIEIISPVVALTLFELKQLYREVMSGARYAIWDTKEKDFFPASPTDQGAGTGYSFCISHWNELQPKQTESLIRQQSIDLINKFRDIALSRFVIVLPAGLRDLEVTADGREQENEINGMYRKLISASRIVPSIGTNNVQTLDSTRWNMQRAFIEIYKYFFDMLEGKKGFLRGKWAARKIYNGTRNVLSNMDTTSVVMGREDAVKPTDTIVGMFQGLKSLLPVAVHAIRTKYLSDIVGSDGQMFLINPKTYQKEVVFVKPDDYDKFGTDEGIEKLINLFRNPDGRHKPVKVGNHYLALIYNDGKEFRVFSDIRELPAGRQRRWVSPITYAELLYLSGHEKWNDYFTLVTRFPVTGQGSTYSSTIRLTTTVRTKMEWELAEDWSTRLEKPAIDFPLRDVEEFVSSMIPFPANLKALGADFDGDTGSADTVYTDESLAENRRLLNTASFWIAGDNTLTIDIETDTIMRTLHNLLGDPQ